MNYLTVLNPVFNRHGINATMPRTVVRSFTVYPSRESDIPTFRRFRTDASLRKLIRECRVAAGNEFRNALFGPAS